MDQRNSYGAFENVDTQSGHEQHISEEFQESQKATRHAVGSNQVLSHHSAFTELVSKVFWLVALVIFGLGLWTVGPALMERYQHAATRGRIRAEYENAVEILDKQPLSGVSKAYQLVAQRIRPSVVSVTTTSRRQARIGSGRGVDVLQVPEAGQGSGVVMSSDGYIITNHHVVKDADLIIVDLADRRRLQAVLVGSDELTDLAVLKVQATGLIPAEWGDSDKLEVGSMVWAVGSPYGLDQTVTQGILSGKHRNGGESPHKDFLQTDAAVNPGNSGGPLVDASGKVVGINTSIFGTKFQGISFAVPSAVAQRVFQELKDNRIVNRGFLGVTPTYVYQSVAEEFDLPNLEGAYIEKVDQFTPAANAGIEVGDIIVKWNGKDIKNHYKLYREVGFTKPDTTAEVDIVRRGAKKTLYVQVGHRPKT